jgi:uncharacterized protein (DUF433 family)
LNIRHLTILSDPKIAGGEPLLFGTLGTRVVDLLDCIDAGDSVEEVAKDFSCDPGSLELLVELREVLKPELVGGGGLDGLRHPDCRACTERERLSVGQLAEIKALKAKVEPLEKRLREAESIIAGCDSDDGFCGEMPDDLRDRITDFREAHQGENA